MRNEKVKNIFEAFFEKYKKTEGDRTSWSAVWMESSPAGILELNMTKCPKGTSFKIFINKKKIDQVAGWDDFFTTMERISKDYPDLYDQDKLFSEMEFVI